MCIWRDRVQVSVVRCLVGLFFFCFFRCSRSISIFAPSFHPIKSPSVTLPYPLRTPDNITVSFPSLPSKRNCGTLLTLDSLTGMQRGVRTTRIKVSAKLRFDSRRYISWINYEFLTATTLVPFFCNPPTSTQRIFFALKASTWL